MFRWMTRPTAMKMRKENRRKKDQILEVQKPEIFLFASHNTGILNREEEAVKLEVEEDGAHSICRMKKMKNQKKEEGTWEK